MAVYFIKNPQTGKIKIGKSKDVNKRLRNLQLASGEKLDLLLVIDGYTDEEYALHSAFSKSRDLGEWFLPDTEIAAFIAGYKVCLTEKQKKGFELDFVNGNFSHKEDKQNTHNKSNKMTVSDRYDNSILELNNETMRYLNKAANERKMNLCEITNAMIQCAIEVYFSQPEDLRVRSEDEPEYEAA